jgi:hypothetical protein
MKNLFLAISVFILFGSSYANAEQVYYCASQPNLATGIDKDKKTDKWFRNGFSVSRYTIKFNDDYTKLESKDVFTGNCFRPFPELPGTKTYVVCYDKHNNGNVFQFDTKTLRFLFVQASIYGFLDNGKDSDTNAIFPGTCQKF